MGTTGEPSKYNGDKRTKITGVLSKGFHGFLKYYKYYK